MFIGFLCRCFDDVRVFPNLSDRNAVEICPDMLCLTQVLCKRISQTGGAALLIDYGHEGEKGDTFRVSF
ncbi:unnamed protein product [Trichobilharzia regenti]|nr:unnamed protein product [Trichobilharzia regenti]